MPFLFYIFGKKIRANSKFSPAPDIAQDKRRDEEARLGTDGENGGMSLGSEEQSVQEKDSGSAKEGNATNGGVKSSDAKKEKGA